MEQLDTTPIPQRAWRDTQKWLLGSFYAWIFAILVCAVLSSIFIPDILNPTIMERGLWGFIGGITAIFLILLITYVVHLWITPYRQRNEARNRIVLFEEDRIPHIKAETFCGRRSYDFEHKHLMWAELMVTNTSLSVPLADAQVTVISCLDIANSYEGKGQEIKRVLYSRGNFSPLGVAWSERDVFPQSIKTNIPQHTTRTCLIAFQNNSNGGNAILNHPNQPYVIYGGGKIMIEVSSSNSATWTREFYIECHPNYATKDGTVSSKFEFAEWDEWIKTHTIANL